MSSYCLSCKKLTHDDGDSMIIGNRRQSHCKPCGRLKSTFISMKQAGRGPLELAFVESSYLDDPPKEISGYIYDPDLSTTRTRVYNNPTLKDTKIVHRGTKVTDKNDLFSDVLITTGLYNKYTSGRLRKAEEISKDADKKYEGSIQSVGHSLGGTSARKTAESLKSGSNSSETYNSGSSPLDIGKNLTDKARCAITPNSDYCKKKKANTEYSTGKDPISISGLLSPGKKIIVKPSSINTHSLSNFK